MSRRDSDEGAATLEMALVLVVLVALLSLVAPLAYLFYASVSLGRAAGDVVRFASSRSDADRAVELPGDDGTVRAGMLPTPAQVAAEALRFDATGPITLVGTAPTTPDARCPSGRRRTVVLTTSVELGPVGAAFAGLTGAAATRVLTTTATSCEE